MAETLPKHPAKILRESKLLALTGLIWCGRRGNNSDGIGHTASMKFAESLSCHSACCAATIFGQGTNWLNAREVKTRSYAGNIENLFCLQTLMYGAKTGRKLAASQSNQWRTHL